MAQREFLDLLRPGIFGLVACFCCSACNIYKLCNFKETLLQNSAIKVITFETNFIIRKCSQLLSQSAAKLSDCVKCYKLIEMIE